MTQHLTISSLSIHRYNDLLLSVDNLLIKNGEIITIMGPSGSGKSTFLAAICGSLDPAFSVQGKIYLKGKPIHNHPPHQRHTGILFQDDLLFPHLSVFENLLYALPPHTPKKQRPQQVQQALESVELAHLNLHNPNTLSGGQRSRVALARALLANPKALLLDEPFSNLDAPLRKSMRNLVRHHIQQAQLPTIMVTHDTHEAHAVKGRIFEIKNHILVEKKSSLS